YEMREDGLYTLNGIPADKEDNWHSDDENDDNSGTPNSGDQNYRYEQRKKVDSFKDVKEKQIQKMQQSVDSLKAVKEKEINKMKDSLRNIKEKPEQKIEKPGEKSGAPAQA